MYLILNIGTIILLTSIYFTCVCTCVTVCKYHVPADIESVGYSVNGAIGNCESQ